MGLRGPLKYKKCRDSAGPRACQSKPRDTLKSPPAKVAPGTNPFNKAEPSSALRKGTPAKAVSEVLPKTCWNEVPKATAVPIPLRRPPQKAKQQPAPRRPVPMEQIAEGPEEPVPPWRVARVPRDPTAPLASMTQKELKWHIYHVLGIRASQRIGTRLRHVHIAIKRIKSRPVRCFCLVARLVVWRLS